MGPVHRTPAASASTGAARTSRIRDVPDSRRVSSSGRPGTDARDAGHTRRHTEGRRDMIVLGLILLIIGLVASIPILTTIMGARA